MKDISQPAHSQITVSYTDIQNCIPEDDDSTETIDKDEQDINISSKAITTAGKNTVDYRLN